MYMYMCIHIIHVYTAVAGVINTTTQSPGNLMHLRITVTSKCIDIKLCACCCYKQEHERKNSDTHTHTHRQHIMSNMHINVALTRQDC